MKVPFVDLKSQYLSIKSEIDAAIGGVLNDSGFIGGKHVEFFEKKFADYLGIKHCVGVGNGTDALFIALKVLGIGAGDEVIVPANSFIATSEAVTLCGAKPVFADCESDTYNISPAGVEKAITKKTKAVIPVHLYGQPARMDEIIAIAKANKLWVVEDSAQAHGAEYKGKKAGTMGDISCFSFFPSKNLGAYGDGGAIVTNDDELAVKARMFANHGRKEKYNHEFEGTNSRLDGLQAAVLGVKIGHLEKWINRRIEIAKLYGEELGESVIVPFVMDGARHAYHLYVIQSQRRNELIGHLKNDGISAGIHYPIPLPFMDAYSSFGHLPEDFPVSNFLKDTIISLPMHGSMTDEEAFYVIESVKKFA